MRIAALYDVHGNVHALEAVLRDVRAESVDRVLFGGDLAAGPLPRETIELARSVPNAEFVLGNADVLSSPSASPEWESARRWVEGQLDAEQIEWLAALPFAWRADDTLYVHANPVDVDELVTERTPDERVAALLESVTESRVVTGHVHIQFTRRVGEIEWIGAGSVGMPYADGPGAYWALVTPGAVEFRRTEYDLEAAAAAMRASGHPLGASLADENVLTVPSVADALAVFS
jgi:predicted phosphodiesterase